MHLIYREEKQGENSMKIRKLTAMLMATLMMTMLQFNAFAMAYGETEIVPKYIHVRMVNTDLEIDSSGMATCKATVNLRSATSDVSIVVALYKKDGSSWRKVTSWSQSSSGRVRLELVKTKTVAHGTYKVVLTGTVTTANGDTERISDTSDYKTY